MSDQDVADEDTFSSDSIVGVGEFLMRLSRELMQVEDTVVSYNLRMNHAQADFSGSGAVERFHLGRLYAIWSTVLTGLQASTPGFDMGAIIRGIMHRETPLPGETVDEAETPEEVATEIPEGVAAKKKQRTDLN